MIIMNIMTTNVDGNNTNLPFSNMPMIRRSWPMTWTWLRCHSLVNWHWRCSTLAEMIGAQPGLDTHTDHHWPKKNSWVVFGATKTFTGHQLHLFIGTHSSSTCLLNFTASNLLIPWFFLSVRSRFFFSRRTCSWSSELLSAAYYRKVPLLETALRRFADPNSQAPVVGETYMTCLSVMCKDVHNFF